MKSLFIPKGTIYCSQCNSMVVKICHADLNGKDKQKQIKGCKLYQIDNLKPVKR